MKVPMVMRVGAVLAVGVVVGATFGCKEGCLAGEEGCMVPSPCKDLSFPTCNERELVLKVIAPGDVLPGGVSALGAVGDILIGNGQVRAVIDAIDNANYIAPTGGQLLDLATKGDNNDTMTHVEHVMGVLPSDAFVYTDMQFVEEPGMRAVIFKGHLAGSQKQRVYTRYEIRTCDPGIRVRTEAVNDSADDAIWSTGDGWYWNNRANQPFFPTLGTGYVHPGFGLATIDSAMKNAPFFAASASTANATSYSEVACSEPALQGFHSQAVSVVGPPRRVVAQRDNMVFERFIAVAKGRGVAPAADIALAVRQQLFDEPYVTMSGKVVISDDGFGILTDENRASIHIDEGSASTPKVLRTPWTHAVPAADGTWTARVPAGRDYVVDVVSFGKTVAVVDAGNVSADRDLGDMPIPAAGALTLSVTVNGELVDGQILFYPADDATAQNTAAHWQGIDQELPGINSGGSLCSPLLGAAYAGSPACNRVLTLEPTTVAVPPGSYDVFATIGPFAQVGHQRVEVADGATLDVAFTLQPLDILPQGTLSADFHVHGSASFDSLIPDIPRVKAFLASRLDVIAATDHDAIYDYADAMQTLQVGNRLKLLVGLETTGHSLFKFNPDVTYPQVIGHYNFFPLPYRPSLPRNGAPYDEFVEPGQLFERVRAASLPEWGVIQLNHPMNVGSFGRAFGWTEAIGLKLNEPLPVVYDGTGQGLFLRKPAGSQFRNSDYTTQEVMNGTQNHVYSENRALWHYLLNQGVIKGGTANSDSHTIVDNVVGTPRTVVFTSTTKQNFDPETFNRSVLGGRMVGTNGPMIDARVEGADGAVHRPGVLLFSAGNDPLLRITVTAAPWVPIDEIRILINGEIARVITDGLVHPADPLGTTDLVRFDGELRLGELLPNDAGKDVWVGVEAGAPLPATGDLDCNGIPDTTDNNGDGTIDFRDVDRDGNGIVNDADLDINGDGVIDTSDVPESCKSEVGPLRNPPRPARDDMERYAFFAVTPGGYPVSFTNPFLLDRNNDGVFNAPGLVGQ